MQWRGDDGAERVGDETESMHLPASPTAEDTADHLEGLTFKLVERKDTVADLGIPLWLALGG